MKEFILNGETPQCFSKWRRWEGGFVKENFGLEMKDYELVASLRDAENHHEDTVKFMKDDGTMVDITLEKYNTIPKSLWLSNYWRNYTGGVSIYNNLIRDNITYDFTLDEFILQLKNINSSLDYKNIANAYTLSKNAHAGQFRENKEPYFNHPVEVSYLSALAGADSTTIKAALLHDVVEDTDISLKTINSLFGKEVAYLVDGMTADFNSHHPTYKENHRKKIAKYSINDPRLNLILVSDRFSNIRTLDGLIDRPFELKKERQKRILESTKEFILPIAYLFCPKLYKNINTMVVEFNFD